MNESKCNFHTHTQRCHHADGNEEDYCRAAVEGGLTCLGFSDHAPVPLNNIPNRMQFADLADHAACVRRAAEKFPSLKVALGFEVEFGPGFDLPEIRKCYKEGPVHTDYLLGANHELPEDMGKRCFQGTKESEILGVKTYLELNKRMVESGMFVCIVHPDFFGTRSHDWLPEFDEPVRDLIASAIAHDVFLEVNAYGMRKPKRTTSSGNVRWQYPQTRFWEIAAEMGAKMVVGMDAHRPVDLYSNWEEACTWAESFGLKIQNAAMAERIFSGKA